LPLQIHIMQKLKVLSLLAVLAGCSNIAVFYAARKEASKQQTPLAKDADAFFWNNYHLGNYDSIPAIVNKLCAALQENPNDLRVTAHLAFTHIWALAERQRIANNVPSAIEHIVLSRKYFEEASKMDPHDPRLFGFLADLTLAEGDILNNKKEQTEGYFKGLQAISDWPQFNKFTLGYIFSNLDSGAQYFKKGLAWQYETMDDCACEANSNKTDYAGAVLKIKQSKDPKIFRACWNSWIAPHNFEGFCMNWGDMLVKSKQAAEAVKIYNLAKQSDSYRSWPFKQALEQRIANVEANIADFNRPLDNRLLFAQNVIMFNSKMACSGCHQMGADEFAKMGYQELGDDFYFLKK